VKKLPLAILILFGGCAVGPNYRTPENDVVDTWASLELDGVVTPEAPILQWWELFEDPLLNKYISLAADHNNDVLTATSNVLQARALRQMAASSFYPQIGADVNATRTYFSKNGPIFAIGPSVGSVPGTVSNNTGLAFDLQVPQTQNLYNALFDATWEIDVFGKTRRTVEAADAVVDRTIDQRNDTLISVMAEIARNYMELRGFQKKIRLIEENIALLEKKSFLVCKQFEAGYVSRLDDENIQATLATERSQLPDLLARMHQSIYTLSILIGEVPETLLAELLPFQPLPKAPATVAVGLRSDLLRRRPDVRRSERDLAAATANIGVAVAAFFPTFTLIGDGGLQSLMLKNLFTLGSKTWAFGGDCNMPIFQGGRLVGNLNAKRAQTAAAAYTYQQTVLQALDETESALISYTQGLETAREKQIATDRYEAVVYLSKERNSKGLISLLNLIDTERQLNQAEQDLLTSEVASLLDLVALYKAVGGGWEGQFPPN
jgi:NodT family efflux transporter outer membrane factor (OMF) lipoprotein